MTEEPYRVKDLHFKSGIVFLKHDRMIADARIDLVSGLKIVVLLDV